MVDIRPSSPNFLKWKVLFVARKYITKAPGFAHGFLSMTDGAVVHYKVTNEYHPDAEFTIAWNDPDIGIEWPLNDAPIISKR